MVSDSKKPPLLAPKDIVEQTNDFLNSIAEAKQRKESGFYEAEGITSDTIYNGWSTRYAALGMAYALQGAYSDSKSAFKTAAELQFLTLRMAYDPSYAEYLGDEARVGRQAADAMDCFSYAMAAGIIDVAQSVCAMFPSSVDRRPAYLAKPNTIDEFVFALDAFFKGELSKAAYICENRIEKFLAKPSKKVTFNSNYYTLHLALWGICTGDQQAFDEGIRKQLTICHHEARYGEWKGMVPGHYAEFAVALTNLAIHAGLKQQVFDPFIPQGLVWRN